MKKYPMILLSILILFIVLGVAVAASFHGTAVGSWKDVESRKPDHAVIFNNDRYASASFRWGLPVDTFDNLFLFDGKGDMFGSEWVADIGKPFLIGDLIYRNGRTIFSETVNSVDLSVALSLNSSPELKADQHFFDFSFYIRNTPNTTGDPMQDADFVSITSFSSPAKFNYFGSDYILEVLGFSGDKGNTIIADFINPEGEILKAGLYGRISETAPVPEPATIILLAAGLSGIVGIRINSKKTFGI